MSTHEYSASNSGLIAALGITNRLASDVQLSSPEPPPLIQHTPHPGDKFTDLQSPEIRPADTSGISVQTQLASVEGAPTITNGSITAAASPVAIESILMWSGRITEIDDDGIFTAELTPLYHVGPIVLGEFELDDLDADDPGAVHEGDLFYLSVTKTRTRGNRVTKNSDLLLRRFGRWSSDDIRKGALEAHAELVTLDDHVG
jgi:hypothetical protein